jgi:uncharacterized protein (TIGR01777 family)
MRFVIAGASGLLGSNLTDALRARGHDVTRLVRRPAAAPDESTWDPYAGVVDRALVQDADVVVNLAGSPLLGNPHGQRWRRQMRDSRIGTTGLLARVIADAERPPAFLVGNGSSYYGDHGAEPVTEESESRGDAFMTQVTRDWQAAADPAVEAGARVCILRTAPVMDRRGGALKVLSPLFRLWLGARLSDGGQYFPVVSTADWVGAVVTLAENDGASGPFNVCCPRTPTNAEFTAGLARAVHRRAPVFVPAPLLQVAAGPAAPELLRSLNLQPAALTKAGYEFQHPDLESVLRAGLA